MHRKTGFTFIEMMITLVLIGLVILPTSYVYRNTVRVWLVNKASLQVKRTVREAMDYVNRDLTAAEGASVMAVGPVSEAQEWALPGNPSDAQYYEGLRKDKPVNIEKYPLVNPGFEQSRPGNRAIARGWKAYGTKKWSDPHIHFKFIVPFVGSCEEYSNKGWRTWNLWLACLAVEWVPHIQAVSARHCRRSSQVTKEGTYAVRLDCPGNGELQYLSLPFYVPAPGESHILVGEYAVEPFLISLYDFLNWAASWLIDLLEGFRPLTAGIITWLHQTPILTVGEGTFGIDLVNLDDTYNFRKTAPNTEELIKWFEFGQRIGDWYHLRERFKPSTEGITSETKVRLKCRVNFELDRSKFEHNVIHQIFVAIVQFLTGGGVGGQINLSGNLYRGHFDSIAMVREEMVLVDLMRDLSAKYKTREKEIERLNSPPDPETELSGEKVTFQIRHPGRDPTAYRYLVKDASYMFEGNKIRNYQLWREKFAGGDWVPDGYNPICEYVTYFKVHTYDDPEKHMTWEFEVTLESQRENPDSPGRWLSSGKQVVMIRPIIPSRY